MQISELHLRKDLRMKHVMMDTEDGSSIDSKSPVVDALSLIAQDPNSAVVVNDEDGKSIGIATEKDIIIALEKKWRRYFGRCDRNHNDCRSNSR